MRKQSSLARKLARPAPSREPRPVRLNVWEQLETILAPLAGKHDHLASELPILADWLEEHLPQEADAQTLAVLRQPDRGLVRVSQYHDWREEGDPHYDSADTSCVHLPLDNVVRQVSEADWLAQSDRNDGALKSYAECSEAYFVTEWQEATNEDEGWEMDRYAMYLDLGHRREAQFLPPLLAYILYRLAGKVQPRLE